MSTELDVNALMPGAKQMTVGVLAREHLGRQVLIVTGAAMYIGELTRVSHYPNVVFLTVKNEGAEAKIDYVPPDLVVWVGS